MRTIFLDTETTGLKPHHGDRIVEIAAIEAINGELTGREFHHYCNPNRAVHPLATRVHGLSDAFLAQQPRFAAIADDFLTFVTGAEVVIHNAPFDLGFVNAELKRCQLAPLNAHQVTVIDTLHLARRRYPKQCNDLDSLALRLGITKQSRDQHSALEDVLILSAVYFAAFRTRPQTNEQK